MPYLRPFSALLSLPLLFQVTLAANGIACINTAPTRSIGNVSTVAMPGMNMSGEAAVPAGKSTAPTDRLPCDGPFTPGGCQPMATCALAALATAEARYSEPRDLPSGVESVAQLAPQSRTIRPKLPPPKA